jgi:[FeFe] hydrogenase H-cluster maturation GTPase HydF
MNVGKSSIVNLISGQETSIVSNVPGTTTDVVEKTMELLPIGPIVLTDTAGLNDPTDLGKTRIEKTQKFFDIMDVAVFVMEAGVFNDEDKNILVKLLEKSKYKNIPLIVIINKMDLVDKEALQNSILKIENFIIQKRLTNSNFKLEYKILNFSAPTKYHEKRNFYIDNFKKALIDITSKDFFKSDTILGDLINRNDTIILIIPIDNEAPKGRLILPQVQIIRDILDNDAINIVVKETQYLEAINRLKEYPKLVVCDSQIVDFMVENTPIGIFCTTFSILFARYKTNKEVFQKYIQGANQLDKLKNGDKILISEACTHHAIDDDIGRIKIPKWIREYTKKESLIFEVKSGYDFPQNLDDYALIIQCGSCMINKSLTVARTTKAIEKGIPISNYGMIISKCKGQHIFNRVLEKFL